MVQSGLPAEKVIKIHIGVSSSVGQTLQPSEQIKRQRSPLREFCASHTSFPAFRRFIMHQFVPSLHTFMLEIILFMLRKTINSGTR
jgi:hypothetical protein